MSRRLRTNRSFRGLIDLKLTGALLAVLFLSGVAQAEPYLAVQQGFACVQCHVNPTGGGQRNLYGNTFAQTIMPAKQLDTGNAIWTGELNSFFSLGGDARASARVSKTPDTDAENAFDLDQFRAYFTAAVIPQRLYAYVDEQFAPGGALNREAYAVYWSASHSWYVKAGQMYLPFGLRLEDQTAFTRQVSGINMTTPDRGVEFGWTAANKWEAQLAISNGAGGGAEVDNGKQYSAQWAFIRPWWRIGLAGNLNDAAAGRRTAAGIFGGLRTGPIVWLAELDVVEDKSLPGGRDLGAALIEGNYLLRKGHNLKITYEYYEPNRDISNDAQTRASAAYEFTPFQFLQLRLIARFNDGIPQVDAQHQRLLMLQAHAFF